MTLREFVSGTKRSVAAGMILGVAMVGLATQARAQDKGGGLAVKLQGTWSLVSIYNEQDGKRSEVFGPAPRGSLIFAPDGRFSLILMKATLPKFAANNRVKGTTEENQAVVQGSTAFFGMYKVVSEAEGKVALHIEGCTFPNWDGQDQVRTVSVTGDEMKMTTPQAAVGGTNHIVWARSTKPSS